jgi:hypothetical protein
MWPTTAVTLNLMREWIGARYGVGCRAGFLGRRKDLLGRHNELGIRGGEPAAG